MRTMFVCLALATIVALVSAHKCDEKMIGFVCGPDAEAHMQKKIDAMTPECKTKAQELKDKMKSGHEEMCKNKSDVTATCTTMGSMFKQAKEHMGEECWPKKME